MDLCLHVQWSKTEILNPPDKQRPQCFSPESRNSSRGCSMCMATLSFWMCVCVDARTVFFFTVYVCSNAAACVCKMVQTLVFPDQLVNHIWGKNLDSFSPFFSAAFPFPPCVFPSLLLHSSEEEKKNNKKNGASFVHFFSVLCPQANFSLVLVQRRGMSYFALITLVSAQLRFRSVTRME